jgi:hypothetical protein
MKGIKMQSRRKFIQIIPVAGMSMIASQSVLAQRPADAVDLKNSQVTALKYVDKTPDPNKKCSNCQLFQGKANDAWGGCPLFGAKKVAGEGWCSAWVKKA